MVTGTLPATPHRVAGDFGASLRRHGCGALTAGAVSTLQINLGKLCNQACLHCHVEAGPKRTEQMSVEVADRVIALMEASPAVRTVDITGGAPELNPHFRRLVQAARGGGREVIDRCNLTILFEPGQEDLAAFLAELGVHVVASLPCYSRDNVDKQRGQGVFAKSIEGLRRLNSLGYGRPGTELVLDLVYNPGGPTLPPPQARLESDYRTRLGEDFGISFNHLYTLTNMPIRRFAHHLAREQQWERYLTLLVESFNPGTVDGLMCRAQVSVGWDGSLYDCDFNQMLELPLSLGPDPRAPTVWDIDDLDALHGRPIVTDGHCFGCTAGAGSSCSGALDG
ncbi:arsenosugar biosynthesis radical SAM (seleno)protein ArsS [Haliangium sp.]|uniref:arsenosugar biosynthesis radical SAM (seleno)protein ArsS n=1 Tax=Haliangium sp. TaxID=2663208 RepID=UPI003D0A7A04